MKDHQNHPQNHPRTTRIGFRGFSEGGGGRRQLQDQDHQNRLQGLQNPPNKQPPLGGLLICMVLKPLKPILVVLGVVLVVLELVLM